MADEEPVPPTESVSEEPTPVVLPPREPLPPPPDMTYTRPSLTSSVKKSTSSSPRASVSKEHVGNAEPEPSLQMSGHGAGLAAGTTFVVSIIAGAVAGNFIDQRWDHTGMPWATLVMTVLGATSGFINMQRILNRSNRNK